MLRGCLHTHSCCHGQYVAPVQSEQVACMQVLLELKQLLDRFTKGSSKARRLTKFLTARGYQQEFRELDGELQARVAQLTTTMHFFHFAQQVRSQHRLC
jgi:hypothetical protein